MNTRPKNSAFDKLRLTKQALISVAGATLMLAAAAPGQAVVVTLSQTVTEGGVIYGNINNNTVGRPLTRLPGATGSSAYGISDATTTVGGRTDAFDSFAGITVDGTSFRQPNDEVDLTTTGDGTFVNTISPVNLGGVSTSLDYFMSASSPTLRVFGTFTNTTGSALTTTVAYGGNLGCDSNCLIEGTSTGGGSFNSALDRWFITSDGPADSDPFITFVRFGLGGQVASSTPAVPGTSSFGSFDNFGDVWTLGLAPGETKSLLWFANFNESLSDGLASTPLFENLTSLQGAGLLSGLSSTQLNQTVNWATTPEPSSILGLGSLIGLGLLSRSKRCKQK